MIEFRDTRDFTRTLQIYTVPSSHNPGVICTAAPSVLLYVDASKSPRDVHWLDLSESKPKPAAGKRILRVQQDIFRDMSFTKVGDKELLIVVGGDGGLFAYDTDTEKLEWKVEGALPAMKYKFSAFGVATDGRGHLFVADFANPNKDGNGCIQMFSVADGRYLGCLMKDKEQLGNPLRIVWCKNTSSLLAAVLLKGKYYFNVINIQF